jgi:hypothetical protein
MVNQMKKTFILIAFVCSTAICSNIYAQQVTPPTVSGDKELRDNNIKIRSVDLERVDRDARKTDKAAAKAEDTLAAKYAEIKTDYEQIQLAQDAVVKTYQGTGKIDYAQISKSALEINKSATRLNSNLFPLVEIPDVEKREKKEDKKEKETKPAKSVRDLIIDLDNAIGSFATSSMFQNLRAVDPEVSEKTKLDLQRIIQLSNLLAGEAENMMKTVK